mgnify:CR=1 FL=1
MKIAFIHYHLKTGGVTTVIKQQVSSIRDTCDVLVLTGEPPKSPFPTEVIHIPGLAYDRPDRQSIPPDKVADSIIRAIRSRWENGCDVLHVHNPTLAKNRNLQRILHSLQEKGITLFLQIHDFAEDGRPHSYFQEPYTANCHYGVINRRDYRILKRAGLKPEGLHLILNTVSPLDLSSGDKPSSSRILYPIRAIRRKNIGEAILLSLYFNPGESLAVTLPPNSPVDIRSYNGWKQFVQKMRLPVEFDFGVNRKFHDVVSSSKYLITTSITEGFGFSFLEPWTGGKFLWGRKLPDICRTFETDGLNLDHLYTRLMVPVDWLDIDMFKTRWTSCVSNNLARFGRKVDTRQIETAFLTLSRDGQIDFGVLDEPLQKQVITYLCTDKRHTQQLAEINPFLYEIGRANQMKELIHNNRRTVLDCYSEAAYRHKLMEVYQRVINIPIHHAIDKHSLVSSFLDLENFSLLKWGDYVE